MNEDEVLKKSLEETLPLGRGVKILAANAIGIFALDKPAGVLTHPNTSGVAAAKNAMLVADYSLKNESYACRLPDGKVQKVYVLNRLDSPTSGVVLLSTNEKIATLVRRAFSEGHVRKVYCAVVCGRPNPPKGIWKDFLRRTREKDGSLRVVPARPNMRDALYTETHYTQTKPGTLVLGGERGRPVPGALLRLEPKTGRTHQLRVQCALKKIPILGDKTYGDFHHNMRAEESEVVAAHNRLFLHSFETGLEFSWCGKQVAFSAKSPVPDVFSEILKFL